MAVLDENNFAAIKKDEWRASLAPTQEKASICLANLHDLLIEGYDSDGYPILWCKKFNEDMVANDGIVRGTKLDRDTFLFQKSLYSGGKLSITSKVEDFNTYAIDATPPIYDLRAKSEKIKIENPISISNSSLSTNIDLLNRSLSVLSDKITLKITKKDSAIQPRNTKDFADMKAYSSVSELVDTDSYEATFNNVITKYSDGNDRPRFSLFRPERVPLNLGRLVDDGHAYPTVAAEDSLLSICKTASIILSNKDTVFEKSLVFGSDFSVYTRICFNLFDSDNWTQRIITQSLINSIVGHSNISASSLRENLFAVSDGRTLFEELLNPKYSDSDVSSFPAGLQYWLKNTYVWIRLAAAGDYVDPKDFNQSLNQDASVAFKNLLVRNESADFNRYDKISSEDSADKEDADSSATSMPYIPKTAPLKDFVSEKYVQEKNTVSETMNALIEDSSKIDSKIGSLWSESRASKSNGIGFSQKKSSDDGDATPLMFFEPDSAKEAADYNRVPVIIPKYGNVMAESRFMGPSEDEIWYMIKKIISGQNKDTVYDQDFSRSRGAQDKRKSLVDTRIKEVNNPFSFKFGDTAIEGDPLDFDIEYNSAKGKISKVSVKEYVVQPEESVFAYNTDDLAAVQAIEAGATGSKTGYTQLTSITLKGTNTYTEDDKPISKAFQRTGEGEDESEYKKWLPRENPLSLRELEARILGNRFSIATNFQYITKNFTVVGGLGKVFTDPVRVDSAGSLYQLHKDYNFTPNSPNTVFQTGGSEDNSSKDVKHYDYDSLSDADKSKENNFKGLDDAAKTVNGLVRYAKNYGVDKSVTTSQNDYTAAQVYMGADGEWHLMNEVVRVPILRSRFI